MGFIAVVSLTATLFAAAMLWPAETMRFVREQWPGITMTAVVAAGAGAAMIGFDEKEEKTPIAAWAEVQAPRDPPRAQPLAAPSVASLIGRLEARLAGEPNDAKGWALLAQSYAYVGNDEAAERALANAVDLGADGAELNARLEAARRGARSPSATPLR